METGNERLFRVLGDVGSDLIATAEQKTFAISPWRRIWPVAACLAAAIGLTMAAAPYFVPQTQPAASAPEPEAVVEEAAPMESITDAGFRQATEQTPVPEVQNEAARTHILPKEQLVFWDMVYYVEAKYTLDEAAELLGSELGAVETADQEEWIGANVYTRQNAEVKMDDKERPVPLEIFVELEPEEGYLYCLTYYHSNLPLMSWTDLQYHWDNALFSELMEMLVLPMEESLLAADLELSFFEQADELNSEQLLHIFLVTLQMERTWGTRTESLDRYLWEYEDGYLIMPQDVTRQLDRYLDQYTFDAAALAAYDENLGGIRLDTLQVARFDGGLSMTTENGSFTLGETDQRFSVTVQYYDGSELVKSRYYSICFYEDRMVYASMGTHSDVPEV